MKLIKESYFNNKKKLLSILTLNLSLRVQYQSFFSGKTRIQVKLLNYFMQYVSQLIKDRVKGE